MEEATYPRVVDRSPTYPAATVLHAAPKVLVAKVELNSGWRFVRAAQSSGRALGKGPAFDR